jgi:hypothetical protein
MTTSSDRAAIRKAFAQLVKAALEGADKPAAKVYDYQVADWGTLNPVVVVTEVGSEWARFTSQGGRPIGHGLAVHVFVLYATPKPDQSITPEMSEDMLSPIANGLAEVVYANQVFAGLWGAIDWEGSSVIDPLKINGNEYRHEAVLLRFR